MNQRLLLTGGQGFLGRYTAMAWLNAGGHVLACGRSEGHSTFTHTVSSTGEERPAPLPDSLALLVRHPRYRYESVDLTDPTALVALLQRWQPTVIIHLAGALRCAHHADQTRINLTGTANLLHAIAGSGAPVKRVILASSGSVYGHREDLAREDHPVAPTDVYSITKVAAEQIASVLAPAAGVELVCARVFNLTGPGADERHAAGRFASRVAAMERGLLKAVLETGPLEAARDYFDVRDAADAMVRLSTQPNPPSIVNLARGIPVTLRHLVHELQQCSLVRFTVDEHTGDPGALKNVADATLAHTLKLPSRPLSSSLRDLLDWHRALQTSVALPQVYDHQLSVRAPRQHNYEIIIRAGLFAEIPSRIATLRPEARVALLTDTHVATLYGRQLAHQLTSHGIRCSLHTVPRGELSKSQDQATALIGELRDAGINRRSLIVCLGGGLVSDLGGYVAATYLRGVDYAVVPTTLLAQHDAAVGGKVAVNTPWSKNFVGAFHHPTAVWTDPELLKTLDDRDIRAGVAEAIKVGMCGEPALLRLLESNVDRLLHHRDPHTLGQVVALATRRKIALLKPDPYEHDLRRDLNLGHTLAHPLETVLAYTDLRHGEAVGFGLAVAIEVARARRSCEEHVCDRLLALLHTYGLPPDVPAQVIDEVLSRLDDIRLVRGSHLHFVLPTEFGRVFTVPELGLDELRHAVSTVVSRSIAA